MCTMIASKVHAVGCAKGHDGWFDIDHVYVAYDHPFRAPMEHAVMLDFVNESAGVEARVGVELDVASARALAKQILEAVTQAEAHETSGARP